MRKLVGCAFVLLAVVFLPVTSVSAAPVTDQLTLTGNDRTPSEFGIASGFLFRQLTIIGEGGVEGPFTLSPFTRTGVHNATFNSAVALTEADGSISDIVEFHIVSTDGTQVWTVSFTSDGEVPLPTPSDVSPPGTGLCPQNGTSPESCIVSILETGAPQEISELFFNSDGATRIPLFSVLVQSDIEASVPEPSTLLLFGSGLAGLAAITWKRSLRTPFSDL
jgi:hypothetical protein